MRKIKLRLWDKTEKRMIYLDKVWDRQHHTFGIEKDGSLHYYNLQNGSGGDEYILMQYTGLKDKNGKEIYEGDIVKVTDEEGQINALDSDTGIGQIEWLEDWGFWNISRIENGLGDILELGYVEVIGDIHENPELLEVK